MGQKKLNSHQPLKMFYLQMLPTLTRGNYVYPYLKKIGILFTQLVLTRKVPYMSQGKAIASLTGYLSIQPRPSRMKKVKDELHPNWVEGSIAVGRWVPEDAPQNSQSTDFFRYRAYGKTATIIINNMNKGDLVQFIGIPRVDEYEDAYGSTRYSFYFIVNEVTFLTPKTISVKKLLDLAQENDLETYDTLTAIIEQLTTSGNVDEDDQTGEEETQLTTPPAQVNGQRRRRNQTHAEDKELENVGG